MSANDFNDFGMSRESAKAKTGVEYLFDGELKGLERLIASAYEDKDSRQGTEIYGAYLAGPYSYEKPIILDLREPKTPAWIRSLLPLSHACKSCRWFGYLGKRVDRFLRR